MSFSPKVVAGDLISVTGRRSANAVDADLSKYYLIIITINNETKTFLALINFVSLCLVSAKCELHITDLFTAILNIQNNEILFDLLPYPGFGQPFTFEDNSTHIAPGEEFKLVIRESIISKYVDYQNEIDFLHSST